MPASGLQKDAFRYLMEDADESSSENNINVMGIRDFPESPHQVNKKVYVFSLVLEKGTPNQCRSRISFNLHPLPVGYYTLVVVHFPPEMTDSEGDTPSQNDFDFKLHYERIREIHEKPHSLSLMEQFASAVPVPRFARHRQRYVVSNRAAGCLRCSRHCFQR